MSDSDAHPFNTDTHDVLADPLFFFAVCFCAAVAVAAYIFVDIAWKVAKAVVQVILGFIVLFYLVCPNYAISVARVLQELLLRRYAPMQITDRFRTVFHGGGPHPTGDTGWPWLPFRRI